MSETSSATVDAFVGACADGAWEADLAWLEEWSHLLPVDDEVVHRDDPGVRDEELLAAGGQASAWDLVLLSSIDPAGLDREGRMNYLRKAEGLAALVASLAARGTVALAGDDATDSRRDRYVATEVAQLRRVGEGSASTGIATARSLHRDYPRFLAALEAGEVSEQHCRVLVAETVHAHDPEVIAALQARLLPKARRLTPGEFRREVRKAVVDLDSERAAERFERARSTRYVTCRPLDDGLGYLGLVTDWSTVKAMYDSIAADGRTLQLERGGAAAARAGDDDAYAEACRADAFAARVLGRVDADGCLVHDNEPATVSLTLVVDLETLRGEADRHALLDGEPVPAEAARELAEAATLWRRAVTEPVTGHLLDYGREQYLPTRLRDYILERDHCRAPGCTARAASRLEMDHAVPFPAGETSAANTGGLCRRHHQQKTAGLVDVVGSAADGSATWVTGWGQRIAIPARPYLHDPLDHRAAGPAATSPPPVAAPPPRSSAPVEWDPEEPPF